MHFIQHGRLKFETDMGVLTGEKNDFVCIPRGVGYRFGPIDRKAPMRSLIVECPSAYVFATPSGYSAGTINFDRHLELAKVEAASSPGGATRLILKLADGDKTTYVLPHDPLAMKAHLGGTVPVWKVNLGNIQQVTSLPVGGPPYPFLSSKAGELVMMNAGRRPNTGYRPPVHVNADYDEIMLYVDGPATWGGCTEPGTLTWVPKGVVHHGVAPFADQPFSSWLLETRATLKWTSEALAESELMETAAYGKHVAQR
jgi:homogentisate 1,2-dioxygenase